MKFVTATILETDGAYVGRRSVRQGWERGKLLVGESGTIYAIFGPVGPVENPPKEPSYIAQRVLEVLDAREQVS